MDETKIAQEVAKNLPPSEPQLNPQYPEAEPGDGSGVPLADYIMTNEVMDYFNISPQGKQNSDTKAQIQSIIEWAKQNAESADLAGLLRALRHAEVALGNQLKPDRINRLYRYVRIQQQKSLLAEKERALYV